MSDDATPPRPDTPAEAPAEVPAPPSSPLRRAVGVVRGVVLGGEPPAPEPPRLPLGEHFRGSDN